MTKTQKREIVLNALVDYLESASYGDKRVNAEVSFPAAVSEFIASIRELVS